MFVNWPPSHPSADVYTKDPLLVLLGDRCTFGSGDTDSCTNGGVSLPGTVAQTEGELCSAVEQIWLWCQETWDSTASARGLGPLP